MLPVLGRVVLLSSVGLVDLDRAFLERLQFLSTLAKAKKVSFQQQKKIKQKCNYPGTFYMAQEFARELVGDNKNRKQQG